MTEPRADVAITSNTLGAGGAERQRVLLANALVEQDVAVTLYLLQSAGALAGEVDPRVRVRRRSYRAGSERRHDLLVTGTTRTEVAFGLRSRLGGRAGTWAVAVHNPVGEGAPRLPRFALAGSALADHLVALTPDHAERITALWGLRPTAVISNAIDGRALGAARHTRDIPVAFLGRLDARHKGLDRLLRAAADPVHGFPLAIGGTGPDEAVLRALADELGIGDRVTWLGFTRPEELLPRVGVLCVLSRFEAQPLVLLEAAATGTPVVASLEVGGPNAIDADAPGRVAFAVHSALRAPRPSPAAGREPREMAADYLTLLEPAPVRRVDRWRTVAAAIRRPASLRPARAGS